MNTPLTCTVSQPTDSVIDNAKKSAIGNSAFAFELTLKQREFEISQLTQRNNFFMIFQGVIIAGMIQSTGTASAIMSFSVCCIGLAISVLQTGVAGGAKFWQMRWERATKTIELQLLETLKDEPLVFQLFTSDAKFLTQEEKNKLIQINASSSARQSDLVQTKEGYIEQRVVEDLGGAHGLIDKIIAVKPSVSRIPILVGIALIIFWAVLLANTFVIQNFDPYSWAPDWFSLVPLKNSK